MPVTTGLSALLGKYQRSCNILCAGTLGPVVVLVFVQRSFILGLTMGSGK